MTERECFIRRICEEPAEDTHRLVFADWLDEHGEHDRAEFIRLQCEFARRFGAATLHDVLSDPESARLRARLSDLTPAQPVPPWLAAVPESTHPAHFLDPFPYHFSRGFIAGVLLPLDTFVRHARELFSDHPITHVRIADRRPSHGGKSWSWNDPRKFGDHDNDTRRAGLSRPIFVHLRKHPKGRHDKRAGLVFFSSEPDAMEALSGACVGYGREQALPRLPAA